jgi:subtilase family serine protease
VAPVPPAAAFTVACTYLECTFRDASVPGSAAITGLTWYFGDGTGGTGPTGSRVYAAAGTYQVTLTVRDGNGLSATVSDLVTVTASVLPSDLVVSPGISPTTSRPGTTIQVTDTTRNLGSGTAQPSRTTFYLSADVRVDAADTLLGSRAVAELLAGAASTSITSLSLPAGLKAGAYFVVARADADDALIESNETNNVAAAALTIEPDPVTRPDLVISAFTAPANGAAGGAIVVSDTTLNQSSGAAVASTTRFFLSRTMAADAAATPLQGRSVGALASSAVSTASTSITIPAGTYPGTYYLIAQADAGAANPELNELNNGRWVFVKIGPDLVVSALSAPTRAMPGGTLAVVETTKNIGGGAAAASSTEFYLSSNTALDPSDIRLNPSRDVPALAANAYSTTTTTLTLPVVSAGTWYLIATADAAATVPEVHDVNNARFAALQMGPDLTLSSVVMPATGLAGGSITVSSTVRNGGTTEAPASVVRFYLSTNLTLDSADVQLTTTRAVPALASDASHSATTTLVLPSNKIGAWYLLLVADADQAVRESIELNNTVARPLQIGAQ